MIKKSGSTITCPFCDRENLQLSEMLLYFEEDGFFDTSYNGEANPLLEQAFLVHNRNDGTFQRHWGNEVKGGKGIILDPEIFLNSGTKNGGNRYTIGRFTLNYDPHNPLKTTIHLNAKGDVTPKALCCPECNCFFPVTMFDYDCYFIVLAGESSVGKTMWLTSLFQNSFAPLTGKCKDGWKLEAHFSANYDGPSKSFTEDVLLFGDYGIIPKETPNAIPPIFLTLTWSNEKREKKYIHNVCVYDTRGESWGEINGKGNANSVKLSRMADALIYFVQPYLGVNYNVKTADDGYYFLNPGDFDTVDEVAGEISPHENKTDENDKRERNIKYGSLFRLHFGGNPQIKKKPFAFVITQIDLYQTTALGDSTQHVNYYHSVFSDDKENGGSDLISSERTALLDLQKLALHNIAAYHIFRRHFRDLTAAAHTFKQCNYFAVSSYTGDDKSKGMLYKGSRYWFKPRKDVTEKDRKTIKLTEVDYVTESQRRQAINIHEPMIWTLLCLVGDELAKSDAFPPKKASSYRKRNGSLTPEEIDYDEHHKKDSSSRYIPTPVPKKTTIVIDDPEPFVDDTWRDDLQRSSLSEEKSSDTSRSVSESKDGAHYPPQKGGDPEPGNNKPQNQTSLVKLKKVAPDLLPLSSSREELMMDSGGEITRSILDYLIHEPDSSKGETPSDKKE